VKGLVCKAKTWRSQLPPFTAVLPPLGGDPSDQSSKNTTRGRGEEEGEDEVEKHPRQERGEKGDLQKQSCLVVHRKETPYAKLGPGGEGKKKKTVSIGKDQQGIK